MKRKPNKPKRRPRWRHEPGDIGLIILGFALMVVFILSATSNVPLVQRFNPVHHQANTTWVYAGGNLP